MGLEAQTLKPFLRYPVSYTDTPVRYHAPVLIPASCQCWHLRTVIVAWMIGFLPHKGNLAWLTLFSSFLPSLSSSISISLPSFYRTLPSIPLHTFSPSLILPSNKEHCLRPDPVYMLASPKMGAPDNWQGLKQQSQHYWAFQALPSCKDSGHVYASRASLWLRWIRPLSKKINWSVKNKAEQKQPCGFRTPI